MKYIGFFAALLIFSLMVSCKSDSTNTSGSNIVKKDATKDFINIGVEDLGDLIANKKDLVILDVRTYDERKNGAIDGNISIDFYSNSFVESLNKLDKKVPYLVYCKSGGRSAKAAKMMKTAGIDYVYNLKGGYSAYADLTNK